MIVNLALVILSALVCNTTVGGGLASLLTMHADGDSLAALAVISTIVQGVAIAAFPQKPQEQTLGLFFSAAVLGFFAMCGGRRHSFPGLKEISGLFLLNGRKKQFYI